MPKKQFHPPAIKAIEDAGGNHIVRGGESIHSEERRLSTAWPSYNSTIWTKLRPVRFTGRKSADEIGDKNRRYVTLIYDRDGVASGPMLRVEAGGFVVSPILGQGADRLGNFHPSSN